VNPAARELLEKLLASAERSGAERAVLPITPRRAKAYFRDNSAEAREAIHGSLRDAGAAGTVALEWGSNEQSSDLRRIRLRDADALAVLLGKPRAAISPASSGMCARSMTRDWCCSAAAFPAPAFAGCSPCWMRRYRQARLFFTGAMSTSAG